MSQKDNFLKFISQLKRVGTYAYLDYLTLFYYDSSFRNYLCVKRFFYMADIIRPEPSVKATIIGQVSLLIWALSVVGAVALKVLPVFEVLFGIFTSGFFASAIINTINGNWKSVLERPRYLILIGIFGIVGNDLFYIMAFRYAPAVQVDLIVCSWPMLVFIFAHFLLSEDIRINHIVACIIAFSGICFLLTSDADKMILKKDYFWGYLFSFLSAILWAIYMVVSKKYSKPTPELFAVYCFVGMIFSAIMHLLFEETIIPTTSQLCILIIMGITTHSIAYYGWDYAIKRGAILSYYTFYLMVILYCLYLLW